MDKLRRVGGSMEPHRRPSGRRALLPAEVQLCDAVGLSEDDYWYFVELAEQYNGKRSAEYDLIPDIRCDPVITPILINLAIGLVLTGVSMLLAPKPRSRSQEREDTTRASLTLGGAEGAKSFAQTEGFQSVQELARLGQTIPLVFARKGIRVNGQLVWSQMIAQSRSLQLKAQFVFSDGTLEESPDFAGLAIGDTTLPSYTAQKVRAYWNSFGGRIKSNMVLAGSGLPPQIGAGGSDFSDVFSVYWDGTSKAEPFFSGAVFTSVQAEFGSFAPMHQNTSYIPTPELILIPKEANDTFKDDLQRRRHIFTESGFSQRSFFQSVFNDLGGGGLGYSGFVHPSPTPGGIFDVVVYRITTGCEVKEDSSYRPVELGFVNSATIANRQSADQNIALGELYMLGNTAMGVCTLIQSTLGAAEFQPPWSPDSTELDYAVSPANDKIVSFAVTTRGYVQCIPDTGGVAKSEQDAVKNPRLAHTVYALQRAAVATVTNSRPCQATELIIKSRVWKQLSGWPDVTAWPSEKLVESYEKDGGSLTLGTVSKYIRRLSFFMLEVRTVGQKDWTDVTQGRYFVVEGSSPVDQYNYIRVDVGAKGNIESEFRLRPVAGVGAIANVSANYYLRRLFYGKETSYSMNGYYISYSGDEFAFTPTTAEEYSTNPEFIRNEDKVSVDKDGGISNMSLDIYSAGNIKGQPTYAWKTTGPRYNRYGVAQFLRKRIVIGNIYDNIYQYWWDGSIKAKGTMVTHDIEPPQGVNENTGIGTANVYVRYYWTLKTPGEENDTHKVGNQLNVYRSIIRQDYKQGENVNTKAYRAYTIDAIPEKPGSVAAGATGLKFFVEVWSDGTNDVGYKWSIAKDNFGTGYKVGDRVVVTDPKKPGTDKKIHGVTIKGTQLVITEETGRNYKNWSPWDAAIDIQNFDQVTSSNTSAPEHTLVAINEKRAQPSPTFEGLTSGGLRINSSTEWSNFSSFSAFIKKGITIYNLVDGSYKASNLLPDIVFAFMTNETWGAGKTIGRSQVDSQEMTNASKFCLANGFTWDGVVGERINFREWVFQNAQYCLLDATVIGGRFALTPAVPYRSDYTIGSSDPPKIKALFTDGNMQDMKVSWLGPSDRQLFNAEVLWREDTINGFPKTQQFSLRIADAYGGSAKDPVETYDLSAFCTSQAHAIIFTQYALSVRKHVDHAISFQTTPQAAMALKPGDYFKVNSQSTHTSRLNNGSINDEGYVTSSQELANGQYNIFYWRAGTTEVLESVINIEDGKCTDSAFLNTVFTLKVSTAESRVYKLESLTYAEDGLVEVTGSHMPITEIGSLKILDWNPAYFASGT